MQIGFTGSRHGMTSAQFKTMTQILADSISVKAARHGVCLGADKEFHDLCVDIGIPIIGHPPVIKTWKADIPEEEFKFLHDPKSYLERNRDIVNSSDVIFAAPREANEARKSGTWSTIRYAESQKKPVGIVLPDGEIELR